MAVKTLFIKSREVVPLKRLCPCNVVFINHTTFMKKNGDNLGIRDTRLSVSEKVSLLGSVLVYMTFFCYS